ncbi:MAG: hypothetical protein OK457_02795 [Thaumarchaeota archaeon]|nr:hypothetical protein [Nitrososphaerota archaeon]
MGPCLADGISIAGGGMLTMNCNGFKILGTGAGIGVYFAPHGPMVHVIVKNCIIKGFAIGISTAQCNAISNSCTANALMNNRVLNSKGDGFLFVSQFSNNFVTGNTAKNNGGYGFDDMSAGFGTAHTANTYSKNHCSGNVAGPSNPTGLC